MRTLLLSLLVLLAANPQVPQEPQQATATVYFYRLRDAYASLLKPSIFADKVQVARMRNGRFMSTQLPAGHHIITSTFPGNGLDIELKAGETYYFRLAMTRATLIHNARGAITQVVPEQGKFEVSQLKPAEPEDLKPEDNTSAPAKTP